MVARKKTRKKTTRKKKTAKKRTSSKKVARKKPARKTTARRSKAKKSSIKKKTKKKTAKKKTKKKIAKKKTKRKTAKKKAKKKTAKKKTKKKSAKKKAKKKTAKKKTKKKPLVKKTPGRKKTTRVKGKQEVVSTKKNKNSLGKSNLLTLKSKSFRRSSTDLQSFKPYRAVRDEEFMNADQTEHFCQILLDWKKLLMEEVDRTVHHMQDDAANFPDPNDRATQEEEFALELRTRDRERKLIRKIDEAMLRLDTNDYGYCEICGVEIGIKRLEARPTATLCIDCKTLDEIKEKQ